MVQWSRLCASTAEDMGSIPWSMPYSVAKTKNTTKKKISNKDILYSTGKHSYYLAIISNGVKSITILNHYVVCLKLI